jgi:hypothetical protein
VERVVQLVHQGSIVIHRRWHANPATLVRTVPVLLLDAQYAHRVTRQILWLDKVAQHARSVRRAGSAICLQSHVPTALLARFLHRDPRHVRCVLRVYTMMMYCLDKFMVSVAP